MDSDHRLVVTPIRLKLMEKTVNTRKRQCFDVELLLRDQRRIDFVETIGRCFAGRKRHGGIDERWAELKKSVLESAQEHLQGRCKKHRKWMTEGTIEIIEAKRMAFLRWQEQ